MKLPLAPAEKWVCRPFRASLKASPANRLPDEIPERLFFIRMDENGSVAPPAPQFRPD
jgi:hypothetical protein